MAIQIPSTFELVKPDYISEDIRPPKTLYRFEKLSSGNDSRFYYEVGRKYIYPYISLTSLISATLPKSRFFIQWMIDQGANAEKIKNETAIFGSVFHKEAFDTLKDDSGYDFDILKERDKFGVTNFQKLFPKEYWEESLKWHYSFTRSLMSFFQFCKDRIIKVLAVETPLRSRKWGYAGTLDLVCIINFKGKYRFAIIDLKSFKYTAYTKKKSKEFYDSHELQLELQKNLWLENYGWPEVDGEPVKDIYLFNLSPNNWRDKPTYNLENQTGGKYSDPVKHGRKAIKGWELFLLQSKLQDLPTPPSKTLDIVGSFDSIHNFNWEDHVYQTDLLLKEN